MANPPITNASAHPLRAGGIVHTKYPLNGLTVINSSGSAIAVNKLVAVVGFDTTSGRPKIVLADADVATHKNIYVTLDAISNGAIGIVWKGGRSTPVLDTSGVTTVGDPVYLDAATAGGFTATAPTGGDDDVVPVGWVTVKSSTVGMIDWYIFPAEKSGTNSLQSGLTFTSPVLTTPQINDTTADHQYVVAVNELAADRTITLPLLAGNDEVAFLNHISTFTNKTLTTPVINTPTITAPSGSASTGLMITKTVRFAETALGVSHVGTIPIPAGAVLHSIKVIAEVVWGATTSATLKVGDTADDDGYFIGVDLKATDLVVGEVLETNNGSIDTDGLWGGKQGAYLVAATGRRGPVANNFGMYYAAGSNILATVTVVDPVAATGRTVISVMYSVGEAIAPVVT